MDAPWKVMNPASFSTILIVLIFASLCKGLLSQNLEYNITVPDPVSVQRGLCVHIPCSFTYDHRDRSNRGKLYGYWLQKKDSEWHYFSSSYSHKVRGILVATNDKRQRFRGSVESRFQLTGKLEEGNCSFSILNAQSEDAGEYYFRIEDKDLKYSYLTNFLRIHKLLEILVTDLEPPQISGSSLVLSGKEAGYTCSASGPCFKTEPEISWTTRLTEYETTEWSQQHTNGSWTYGSNFTFTPSQNSQNQWLTCQIRYPHTWTTVQNSIQIDIADPPKTVEISTNATDHGHIALCSQESQGDLDSAVVREGESVSLHCKAKSKPDSTLSWTKGNKTLESTQQGQERVILLSNVRPGDAGEYQCWAENPFGSANKTLRLCVLYGPRLSSNQSRSTCWREDHSLHCNCSLNSWPHPQIQWEVDGQALNEDSTKGAPEFTTSVQENGVTSSLIWTTGNLDKSHNLICRGANHMGTYALHFLFIPSTKGSSSSSVVSGLCGALVAIILCVLCLGLIKFYKQKKAKASSKAGRVEVLNSANGGHQRANDGSLIYSNIPHLGKRSPCNDQSQTSREKNSTSSRRVLSTTIPEPEELYYATLQFSKLKAKEPTSQDESVEYTEVKQK